MPKLVVRLFNYAEISPRVATRAEHQSAAIFGKAGILLSWVECAVTRRDEKKFEACEQVVDPLRLYVNVINQPMAEGLQPGRFGTSFEKHAVVFYHVAAQAAENGRFSESLILGCVLAHEVGHLLLGEKSHSTGIMTDTFRREDFERAEHGKLLFTRQQAEAMQRRILQSISR